jgi:tRNA G26 N,N-dimethylase Trm1
VSEGHAEGVAEGGEELPPAAATRITGVSEGRAEGVVAEGAFLSSEGQVQRDLTVVAMNAFAEVGGFGPDSLVFLDAQAASGLRALRVALEVQSCRRVWANDSSDVAHERLTQNVGRHQHALARCNVAVECSCRDASELMAALTAARQTVDVIDIDPFGSPMHAVPAALACIRPGGLLSLAFFDVHVLCGSRGAGGGGGGGNSAACFARYGSTPLNLRCSHEVAVRIALASVSRIAAGIGRRIEPLLCANMHACVRLLVRVHAAPPAACDSAMASASNHHGHELQAQEVLEKEEVLEEEEVAAERRRGAAKVAQGSSSLPLAYIWKCRDCCGWTLQEVCAFAHPTRPPN